MTLNKKGVNEFNDPIGKQINIFNELETRLGDTVKEDKEVLLNKLKALDQEIYENMLDQYEDFLENNEVLEEVVTQQPKDPVVKKKHDQLVSPQYTRDEEVLERLMQEAESMGLKEIKGLSKSFLQLKGFNKHLGSFTWEIHVGHFVLKREELFTISFKLRRVKKKINQSPANG
ncbi:MAG: hypothetical protein ABJQ69_03680 [Ekhidna sp.]